MALFAKPPKVLYHLDEENIKNLASARLVRTLLHRALEAHATEIILGHPAEAAEGAQMPRAGAIESGPDNDPDLAADGDQEPRSEWVEVMVRNNLRQVAVWFKSKNELTRYQRDIAQMTYIQILWLFELLQVGIGDSGQQPGVGLYIELEPKVPNTRRFVRSELIMATDNTMRIHLSEERVEPQGVVAWMRF